MADDMENKVNWEVHNLTAKRIGIASKKGDNFVSNSDIECHDIFIVPPFGKRKIEKKEKLDYEQWEKLNLIKISREATDSTASLYSVMSSFANLIGTLIIPIIFLVIFLYGQLTDYGLSETTSKLITLVILLLLLFIVIFYTSLTDTSLTNYRNKLKDSWKNIKQSGAKLISLLLLMLVGIGMPALVIYFFGGGRDFSIAQPSMSLLGRIMQLIFIAFASIFPALLYFTYTEQKLGILQDNFYREIVKLDPKVITLEDARSFYENKVIAVYGSEGTESNRLSYEVGPPVFLATVVITMGWIFAMRPFGAFTSPVDFERMLFIPEKTPLVFGFLGAYFFAINMLFRRYARSDLRPKVYSHITVHILLVFILVWVLSEMPFFKGNNSILLAMAFIVGIFPETGLTMIQEYLRSVKIFGKIFRPSNEKSLEKLDGINLYHRAQLLDEDIENIENLAHHDIIDLLLQTRIPVHRLLDWVDQAILHLHIDMSVEIDKEEQKKDAENKPDMATMEQIRTLRKYGIRTATDLQEAYKAAESRHDVDKLLMSLESDSNIQNTKVRRFQVILDTLRDDEWMEYIRKWRNTEQFTSRIFTIDDMIRILQSDRPSSKNSLQSSILQE